jgi:hypothetical protein
VGQTALQLWCLATAAFGGGVGLCELIARYGDAPFDAIRYPAALGYVVVNAVAAVAAYAIIVTMDWGFDVSPAAKPLAQAAVAGFGAMAFFRSSLSNVKIGDTDVAVGPAILFQVLMFATDRAVDRTRGEKRSELATNIMNDVSFELAKEALPNFCFELMQNVPLNEQQNFRQVVDALASKPASEMRDSVKALNLGLMLMNVVGKQVLSTAVDALGERIQGATALEAPVIGLLRGVVFDKAFPALIEVCFVMSRYGTDADRAAREKAVRDRGEVWRTSQYMDNATKVTILALVLQLAVGDTVLLRALVQLDPSIYDRAAPTEARPAMNVVAMPRPPEAQGENQHP